MKLKYIDALRGIAILLVMATHTFQYSTSFSDGIFNNIISQGARGVQLFFIISAFTLFISFNNRIVDEKNNIDQNFFIRRFFRIAPMYYIGILYFLFQDGFGSRYWLGDFEYISVYNILSNIFFINDFNPYWITSLVPGGWSIGVEMTFYLIVPFLVRKLTTLSKAVNFTLVSIMISLILFSLLKTNFLISSNRLWNEYLFFYFPNQLPVFGFGILLYYLLIRKDYKLSKNNVILGIVTLVSLFALRDYIHSNLPFAFLFSIFIYLLSKQNLKLFVNRVTIYIGNISYSSYLVHFAILHWLSHFGCLNYLEVDNYLDYLFNFLLNFLVICSMTFVISNITYILIEKPFINLGRKFIKQLN
ncbi:acyltransferase [Olleya sp. Ti.3.14]|uniref:acyltransferase family protein n=1 Tax=Olleya sp. Ti.3.14 TaxID=3121297 RepID=UPI00311EB7E5